MRQRPRRTADVTEMETVLRRRTVTTRWASGVRTFIDTAPPRERYYVVYAIHRVFKEGLLTARGVEKPKGLIGMGAHITPPDVTTREGCGAIVLPMVTDSRSSMSGAADGAVLGLVRTPREIKHRFNLLP